MAQLQTAQPRMGTAPRIREAVRIDPDFSWNALYRAGAAAAFLATFLYVCALIVSVAVPTAPTEGGAAILNYIAAHRSIYILEQILWLTPSVPLMIVFLALAVALKGLNKSYAAIGGVLGIASWALTLVYPATGGGAPALVYLSDRYAATSDPAQQAAFTAAAETFIAQNVIPTAVGILEPAGILIVSLIMLRGIFGRGVTWLGIVTGALGLVSEALRPLLGPAYIVYGLLLFAWFIAIGWALLRLSRNDDAGSNAQAGEPNR